MPKLACHVQRGAPLWLLTLLLWSAGAWAGPAALPEPLTLAEALAAADDPDAQLQQVAADVDAARAGVAEAEATQGVSVWVEGRLRWVDPPDTSPDQSHNDNKLSLFVSKNLYDFGRSSAQQAGAAADLAASEQLYLDSRRRRRLEIMQRYFDVLRADLAFARDDEAMAVSYVTLDRLRNRRELGQASDLDVAAQESDYEQTRRQRYASEGRMRATRARLATALNRPGMLPATLATPQLPQLERKLPEYQALLDKALTDNLRLAALRQSVEAARQRLDGAYAGRRPTLNGELEASDYARHLGSNDSLRAGIYLQVPLYDGGTTHSAVARCQAALYKAEAQLREGEEELRQAVLDQWLELDNLRIQREQVAAQRRYRDLYLDNSRAKYEMELQTDLGDAMVRLSEAQLAEADVRFSTALAWERMDALTGGALSPLDEAQAKEQSKEQPKP